MLIVAQQLLCIAAAVALSYLLTPVISEERLITWPEFYLGPLAHVFGLPTAKRGDLVECDVYEYGDTRTEPYRRKMHLWLAALLGATVPLLDLGRNPWGAAGLTVLAALFAHLATIDMGEKRLPHGLTALCTALALVIVGGSALSGFYPNPTQLLLQSAAGALVVALTYRLMYRINPDKLGFGDVQMSMTVGLILGWGGLWPMLYGFGAAWFLQGSVSLVLWMFSVTSRKAMLPLGPAIVVTSFMTPLFLS